jgi:hypothetical protein
MHICQRKNGWLDRYIRGGFGGTATTFPSVINILLETNMYIGFQVFNP